MSGEVLALVNYYARSGYHRHVQTVCNEVLKKRGGSADPTIVFWRAVGLLNEGAVNEAVRELDALSRKVDIQLSLPVKLALLHAHRACRVVDSEEVAHLEEQLRGADAVNAPDRARLQAAMLLWHLGDTDTAKFHTKRLLQLNPRSVQALTLMGWLHLADAEEVRDTGGDASSHLTQADEFFDSALEACSAKKDLEALMGKARLCQVNEKYKDALEFLNQVIVLYAWFLPALVEKCSVQLSMADWDQAVESAGRVLAQDAHNIEALRITALYHLAHQSKYALAATRISDTMEALDRQEPQNAALYYKVSRPLARLSGRQSSVLQLTLSLVDRACKQEPSNCEYLVEYGYQQMLMGDLAGASGTLKKAASLEDGTQDVMPHMIKCQVLLGQLDEAEQQLEFFAELEGSFERTAEMSLCSALLARAKHANIESLELLDEALEIHTRAIRRLPFSSEYFVKLNPEFLLEVGREYLQHCGSEPEVLDEAAPAALILNKATKLLQIVTTQAPGLLEGQILLARARFLQSNFDAALRCCSFCTKADPAFVDAALLHAQVLLRQEKYRSAHTVLEQALAHNFSVRDSPVYHIVKARVLQTQGELDEAVQVLQTAMSLPGVRASNGRKPELSSHDRCSVYVQLVEVLLAVGNLAEASSIMSKAVFEFSGSSQEGRVTIINAQVEVQKGHVETAINMLKGVESTNPHYHAARKALAELYLTYRNDRRAYAACHEELVKGNPTVSSYIMLGEAYMNVSEADKAIEAFEKALLKNPGDSALASRIGKVLVTTHDYVRAIDYYSEAVARDPSQITLRYELTDLYIELKKYDQAHGELQHLLWSEPEHEQMSDRSIDAIELQVKALCLLARIAKEQESYPEAIAAMMRARTLQTSLLARVRVDAPDMLAIQRQAMSDLNLKFGSYYEIAKDGDSALESYEEALRQNDANESAMLALAKLRLCRGEHEQAQAQCVTLMRIDPVSQEGSMMLADIMLQKSEWEAAIYHFQQLLQKTPAYFKALAKLVQLLRRAGRLGEASRYLKQAERSSPRAALEPGFRFCQGLLARYLNDPRGALKALNLARRDGEWGEAAVINMIEVYLNPENETNWDELVLDDGRAPGEGVTAAEKLLRELPRSPRQLVLECYTLMAHKSKSTIEKAASILLELLSVEREFVPAIVCLSQAYLMLKQAPKARNHLKRVAKMQFMAEYVDDFERGWLMLSDVYIAGGKYDLAEELCKKCISANKSCAKAWEFLGVVKEKEMSYRDAASHYENAWKYENEASAAVGYKLSFNYLKAKKYVEAIDVCHKVLTQYPDYPKIRKDVLEKARTAMRP